MKLEVIEQKIKACQNCLGLTKLSFNTVSLGQNTDILFIGESPAKNGWLLTGKAFYDQKDKLLPTGRILNNLLKILDLTIDDITFTETCKCYIPDRKILKEASRNCSKFLKKQIIELDTKIIIPLGEHPTRILINENFKQFKEVAGQKFYRKFNNKKILIIPIYHPSPINPKSYQNNIPIFETIKKEYLLSKN